MLFSKKSKNITKKKANSSSNLTIISSDVTIVGNITATGMVQIEGNLLGNLVSKSIVIGTDAHVKGDLKGDFIHVSGNIEGNIQGDTIEILKSAKIIGDILHNKISIDQGAVIEGYMKYDLAENRVIKIEDRVKVNVSSK